MPVTNGLNLVHTDRLWYEQIDPDIKWPNLAGPLDLGPRTFESRSRTKLNQPNPINRVVHVEKIVPKSTEPKIWNLPFFLRAYSKTSDLHTIIISFLHFFSSTLTGSKRVLSCFRKIAEIHEKSINMILYDVFNEIGDMAFGKFLHEWWFTYDSIVLSLLEWKNDLLSIDAKLPTLKAQIKILVISLPRTVAAFEADPAGHFFHSRD